MCVLTAFSAILSLNGCRNAHTIEESSSASENTSTYVTHDGLTELICLCNSQKEAEDIAKKYDISLKVYSYGVATFETDKDPEELFKYGKKHKLPELSYNTVYHID